MVITCHNHIAMGMVFQQVSKQFDTLLPFTPYFSHVPSRPGQWNLRHGTSSKWSRSCKAFTTSVILLRGVLASSSTAAKVTGSWRLIVAAFSSHISLTHWWLQSCNKCIKPVLNNDINNLSACAGISVINSIIVGRALIMNSQFCWRFETFEHRNASPLCCLTSSCDSEWENFATAPRISALHSMTFNQFTRQALEDFLNLSILLAKNLCEIQHGNVCKWSDSMNPFNFVNKCLMVCHIHLATSIRARAKPVSSGEFLTYMSNGSTWQGVS